MGANSSTSNGIDKTRRRMSSTIVNEDNNNIENIKIKTQSMYDLQRERSLETIKATAVAINNLGAIDKIEGGNDSSSTTNEVEDSQVKKKSPTNRLLITSKRNQSDKTANKLNNSNSLIASSNTLIDTTTTNSLKEQKRRPLTWAWVRGHDVNLSPSNNSNNNDKRNIPNRMTLMRRRSLKNGNSIINRSISQQQNEWRPSSPIQRQSTVNKLHNSTSLVNALSRRASCGRPLLSQIGAQKSIRKSDVGLAGPSNPISPSGREIIQLCFEQPHNDIGARICSRLLEKRPDFRNFVYSIGKDRWLQMTTRLRQFLDNVVRRVDNVEAIEKLARKYGEEHVELKCYGFKPDFWVSLADAMTVECVILDQATHQPSDTITAWSLLVSLMFSAVRDGYYQAMRAQRISQRHRNVQQRELSLRLDDNDIEAEGPRSFSGVEKSASAHELQSPVKRNDSQKNTFRFAEQKASLIPGEQQQTVKNGDKKQLSSLRKVEFF